ncbi:MAG: hypothetical protein K2W78_15080 [Xanthobacteraceae bacterium]|nr:hypothetical protein [Xanthobacteraceae bacterium]
MMNGIITERILAYAAIAAFMGLAVTLLPGFAPDVADASPGNHGPVAMAKADRLPLASDICAEQDWPNISSGCLRHPTPKQAATNVRFVTAR